MTATLLGARLSADAAELLSADPIHMPDVPCSGATGIKQATVTNTTGGTWYVRQISVIAWAGQLVTTPLIASTWRLGDGANLGYALLALVPSQALITYGTNLYRAVAPGDGIGLQAQCMGGGDVAVFAYIWYTTGP